MPESEPPVPEPGVNPAPDPAMPPSQPEPVDPPQTIWTRPERASRGPAPEYSRSAIAAAAIALADSEGLTATTMRRVATAIGTAPASLYRYVANRDELIALMADAVVAELAFSGLPSGSGWPADILAVAHQLRALYRRHPWLLELMPGGMGGPYLGPAAVDYLEGTVAALSELDVPGPAKMVAVAMLTGVTGLFARDESANGAQASAQAQAANAAYIGQVVAAGKHPHLTAVIMSSGPPGAGADVDPEDLFDRVILGVMAGLLGVTSNP